MRSRLFGAIACIVSLLAPAGAYQMPADIAFVRADDAIVQAFERFPLVAFSEPGHGAGGTLEFLSSIVRHPKFQSTVNDIVVEFGNARYQNLADRYIAGESISRDELRQIWENTTIVTGVWTAPMYEGFLREVRAVNADRPANSRLRVLLGDPPIDWQDVQGPADEDMNDWRDAHFAWVVEEQVMKKRRRALLWIGGAHLSRRVILPESLIHLLDRRFPQQTLVVLSVDPRGLEPPVLNRLSSWPSSRAVSVRNTWIGRASFADFGGKLSVGSVEENVDMLMFWPYPPTHADQGPRIEAGSPYATELRRRRELADRTLPFRGGAIRFEANVARLAASAEPALAEVLAELTRDRELTLLVKAYSDARETNGYNLSVVRARLVVEWLVKRGVAATRLEPRGCGASRAFWIGVNAEQRAANRRADLVRRSPLAGCEPPLSFDFR